MNRNVIIGVVAVLIIAVVAVLGYSFLSNDSDDNNVNVIVDNKEYRISDIYKLIDRTSINLIKNIIRSIVND